MADLKISQLTGASTPLAGTEALPIVQSGSTVKVSVANLTAGRAISATELTLTTGNLIVSSGKGIDFSATPGTGTSELLADYEEGIWSPTLHTNGTDFTSVTYAAGRGGKYTKVGNVVHIQGVMVTDAVTLAGASGTVQIGSLPFTVAADTGSTDDGLVSLSVGISLFWASNRPARALGIGGTDRINLYYSAGAGSDTAAIVETDVTPGAGANILTFAGTYVAA